MQMAKSKSEVFQITRRKLQKGVKPNECPLLNKDIGVISEIDHSTGTCLCSLCTCKKHICPGTYFHEPYPKSIYSSQYSSSFQQKTPTKTAKFSYPTNFFPLKCLDFETTNSLCYTPHPIVSTKTIERPRPQSAPKALQSYSTTYANSYLHWEVPAFPIMKQEHIDHTKAELKLTDKTIYSENFQRKKGETAKMFANVNFKSSAAINFGFPKESVQRADYKKITKRYVGVKGASNSTDFSMKPTNGQYFTTMKKDYTEKQPRMDHRSLSKLMSKY